MTKPLQRQSQTQQTVQILYYDSIARNMDGWAASCGVDAHRLRAMTEFAIRNRRAEAFFDHPVHEARGRQPAIYSLKLDDSIVVYFTEEPAGIMVRGFGWEIPGEPADDFDGGGFFSEYDWS